MLWRFCSPRMSSRWSHTGRVARRPRRSDVAQRELGRAAQGRRSGRWRRWRRTRPRAVCALLANSVNSLGQVVLLDGRLRRIERHVELERLADLVGTGRSGRGRASRPLASRGRPRGRAAPWAPAARPSSPPGSASTPSVLSVRWRVSRAWLSIRCRICRDSLSTRIRAEVLPNASVFWLNGTRFGRLQVTDHQTPLGEDLGAVRRRAARAGRSPAPRRRWNR